eukprot:SM000227S07458  [mRNA]  locus=s227:138613:142083:- [translate_table: standard]
MTEVPSSGALALVGSTGGEGREEAHLVLAAGEVLPCGEEASGATRSHSCLIRQLRVAGNSCWRPEPLCSSTGKGLQLKTGVRPASTHEGLAVAAIASAAATAAAAAAAAPAPGPELPANSSVPVSYPPKGGASVRSAGAPCKPSSIDIAVSSYDDFLQRTEYPADTTVTLTLQQNITLSKFLLFTASYNCTLLRSDPSAPSPGFTIAAALDDFPALIVTGASHLSISGVGFHVPVGSRSKGPCNPVYYRQTRQLLCPAVYVNLSNSVSLESSHIYGRVEITFAEDVKLDALVSTTTPTDFANIRITESGDAPALIQSRIVVSNCDVSGGIIGVMLCAGAVGVTVVHNSFHNFGWAGVQVGQGIHNTGDASLNNVSWNYVARPIQTHTVDDSGGIYMDLHWINPGNYLSCNYIVGGEHCLYLDYAPVGVTVDGLVCLDTFNGVKQNQGKSNNITGVTVVRSGVAAWIGCLLFDINNCDNDPGSFWEMRRRTMFNSPEINQRFPHMKPICTELSIDGEPCNPSGSVSAAVSARCSGLPTHNYMEVAVVESTTDKLPEYQSCDDVTNVAELNSMRSVAVATVEDALFSDANNGDYGLTPDSPIYATFPGHRSCPRALVGPQKALPPVGGAQAPSAPAPTPAPAPMLASPLSAPPVDSPVLAPAGPRPPPSPRVPEASPPLAAAPTPSAMGPVSGPCSGLAGPPQAPPNVVGASASPPPPLPGAAATRAGGRLAGAVAAAALSVVLCVALGSLL